MKETILSFSRNGRKTDFADLQSLTPEQLAVMRAIVDAKTTPDTGEFSNTRLSFDQEEQRYILGAILHSEEILRHAVVCNVKHFWWTEEACKLMAQIALGYYRQYTSLPTKPALKTHFHEAIAHRSDKVQDLLICDFHNIYEYFDPGATRPDIIERLTRFARHQQMIQLTYDLVNMQSKGEVDALLRLADQTKQVAQWGQVADAFDSFDAIAYFDHAAANPIKWLIENCLPFGGVTLFTAPRKLGKSTFLHSLIPALCSGNKWLESITVPQCPVIYLDYENPVDYVVSNLLAHLNRHEWEPIRDQLIIPKTLPSGLTVEWVRSLIESKSRLESTPGFVIIDSGRSAFNALFPAVPGWDNVQSEVRKAIMPFSHWAHESGWAVIIVHHTNKAGTAAGNMAWEETADMLWEYREKDEETRRLKITGRLSFSAAPPEITVMRGEHGLELVETQSTAERILEAIPISEGGKQSITVDRLIQELELSQPTVSRTLAKLTDNPTNGICREKITGKKGRASYRFWVEPLVVNSVSA